MGSEVTPFFVINCMEEYFQYLPAYVIPILMQLISSFLGTSYCLFGIRYPVIGSTCYIMPSDKKNWTESMLPSTPRRTLLTLIATRIFPSLES